MKDMLQAVCRELDLPEISGIPQSLAKLKAVVKLVPRMERFIAQICGFVCQRENHLLLSVNRSKRPQQQLQDEPAAATQPSMEHTMHTLMRYYGKMCLFGFPTFADVCVK